MGTVLKALLSHFRDKEMEAQRDLHKLSPNGIAELYFYFAFPAGLAPSVPPSFMSVHHWLLTSCQGETGVAWQGSIWVVITHWPSTPVHRTWEKVALPASQHRGPLGLNDIEFFSVLLTANAGPFFASACLPQIFQKNTFPSPQRTHLARISSSIFHPSRIASLVSDNIVLQCLPLSGVVKAAWPFIFTHSQNSETNTGKLLINNKHY